MEHPKKTREQFIKELDEMRRRVVELERSVTEHTQTERALREREERFRSLVETTSDWVWEIDRNSRYTYSSQKVRDIIGYEPEQIIGKTPFDFMSPQEAKRTIPLFKDIARSRKAFSRLENTNLHKDGRTVVLETSGVPVFDEKGNLSGYKGIDRDITERKQAEEALRESEVRYRSIFENSIEGICLTTREGKFLMANPAFFRMLGYGPYDEMTQSIADIHDKLYVNPEDRQRLMEVIERDGVARGFEAQFYKKDGNKIWVSFNMWSIHDVNGRFLYFQSMGEDITERKEMEDALLKSEEKYRSIFENAVMGILRTTPDGRYLSINPAGARMYGYESPEEMMQSVTDMSHQIYVHPEDRERIRGLIESNGFVEGFEAEHYTKDGGRMWASINARVVRDTSGAVLYYESTSQNITERKRLEHKLAAMSVTDELTGIYNRRGFLTLTQQQLKIGKRAKQDMLLFFADLDNMKQINDTMGHKEGDRALIDTAGIFKQTFRESDIVGRMGGDEFAVFAINTTDATQQILTARLQNNLDNFNDRAIRPYKLLLSIGIAHYDPKTPCSIDELVTRADALMYEQKKGKRYSI